MGPYFNYRGRTIAITGATGGLGLALAEHLTVQGAQVTPIARQAQWEPAAFDLVFLNAGIGFMQACDQPILDEAEQIIRINFLQTVEQAQRALSGRCQHVHVVGSVVSHVSAPHLALYAASKHALRGWAYGAARELPGRVSISYPNGMRSKFFSNLRGDPALIERYAAEVEEAQVAYDPPELVAQGILKGIRMGAREIIPTPYALEWFINNEVDIRRMWHPPLNQPSVTKWDWWDGVQRYMGGLA